MDIDEQHIAPAEELPQAPSPYKKAIEVLLVLALILILGLGYLGWHFRSTPAPPDVTPRQGLTDEQKQEIINAMGMPPELPPLTSEEKKQLRDSMGMPPATPPLTEEQKQMILDGLDQ